jgi:hypothetical protein
MIRCPKCNATLPASYQRCQFCQTDVTAVGRPVAQAMAANAKKSSWGPEPWMVTTYHVIAGLYIFFGALSLLSGSGALTGGHTSIVPLLAGGFTALVGLSLVFKWDVFLSVIYLFLGLHMAGALLSLLLLSAALKLGPIVWVMIMMNLFDAIITGLMFYLYPKINDEW